jgi:hypothetical protein
MGGRFCGKSEEMSLVECNSAPIGEPTLLVENPKP